MKIKKNDYEGDLKKISFTPKVEILILHQN